MEGAEATPAHEVAAAAEQPEGAFPSQYDANGMSSFDRVEMDLRGASLTIICNLPDGQKPVEVQCNMGHDVAYAKGQLARVTDIPYGQLHFFLDDKLMFDPLSFNDFPAIVANEEKRVEVQVKVKPEVGGS